MAGDFDQDGVVGLGDLAVLQASMGLTSSSVDLSGDGVVNLADAAIWTRDFGRTSAGLSPPTPDEPASIAGEFVGRTRSGLRATRVRPPHSPREDRLDEAAVDSLMTSVVRRGRHDH
jgi:hypothetical protein